MKRRRASTGRAATAAAVMMFGIASVTTATAQTTLVPATMPERDASAIASLLFKDPVKPPATTKPPTDLRDRQDEAKKRAQEEARRRAQEEARRRAQDEAKKRAQEEAKRRAAEQARQRAQEEAKQRAAEQARQRAQEQARERAAEQARQRAQEQARERAAEQARQRAQDQARERAAEHARQRAQEQARERAAEQARQRAQEQARERAAEQARERAADLARERAQQEARQRALEDARRRAEEQARDQAADAARRRAAESRARELAEEAQRNRAQDLARERAMEEARQRAIDEARRRNAQEQARDLDRDSSRTVVPPPSRNTETRTREPVRVDPESAAAIERAVESARERAEARLERERAARESAESATSPGNIRITPRHSAESIDPVQPGEIRITPGQRERFEVLREPETRNRTLTATSAAEASKREVERQRESIHRGTTVPTRAFLDREVDLPSGTGGGLTLPGGNNNAGNSGSGNASSQGGSTFAQPGGANAIGNRNQLPIQRYAPNHTNDGSSNYHNDYYGDDWHDDYRYEHDYDHFYDHHHWKYGHRSYRDYCDSWGYRRYRFYDHWGYDRSCSPWFSFHIFYGYRWRAYCDPYWDWWIRPGYTFRFYYDYGSSYHYRPWYTDVRYVTTYQTVYRTEVEYIEVPVPTPPPALTANDAWRLVSEGYYREARNAFSRLSIERPEDGTLRIGYAIASGLEYDAGAAVFAMRRALELDPISVRLVPVDAVLRRRVLDLIDHFAAESRRNEFDRDALFMVAALNTVIGEDGLAFFALDRAIDLGDDDISTYNLESIIRQRMEERMGTGR